MKNVYDLILQTTSFNIANRLSAAKVRETDFYKVGLSDVCYLRDNATYALFSPEQMNGARGNIGAP